MLVVWNYMSKGLPLLLLQLKDIKQAVDPVGRELREGTKGDSSLLVYLTICGT